MRWSLPASGVAVALAVFAVAILLLVISYRRTLPPTGPRFRGFLFAARSAVFLLLLLAILDPVITMARVRDRDRVVAVLLDTSLSMSLPERPGDAARGGPPRTRWTAAQDLLWGEEHGEARPLVDDIRRKLPVRFFAIADGAREIPLRGAAVDSLAPRGGATDLARAIRDARRAVGPELAAMVVVSDGRNTAADDAGAAARDALVPVHTVLVGEDGAPPDLAVVSARAPETAYAGSRMNVEYELSARGFGGRAIGVLLREDGRVVDSVTVAAPAAGTLQGTLAVTPSVPGTHRYTVSVPAAPGEIVEANNDAHLLVNVEKQKLRVLYLEPVPRWDFAFLGRALAADAGLAVTWRTTGEKGAGFPGDRELADTDVLVLGNFPFDTLDHGASARLANFVSTLGRGLLILGGDRAFRPPSDETLARLLPLRAAGHGLEAGSWYVSPTAAGTEHAVTRLARDGATNRVLWESLPPLLAMNTGLAPAPGADVLLEAARRGGTPMPLLAVSRAGAGKVAAFAGSGLWRWSFLLAGAGRGSDAFDRLAASAVRWLASREETGLVRATPDRSLYRYGEPVGFTARVFDEDLTPRAGATVRAVLVREDSAAAGARAADTASIVLEEIRGNEGVYRGRFGAVAPGRYHYRVEARAGDRLVGETGGRTDVVPASLEFEALETDPALLERIASETGGGFFRAADARGLLPALERGSARSREATEVHPGRSAWLFVAVVLLLGCEWSVRRRRGLW